MGRVRRIGVVTVTYNSAEVLPEFLESVSHQTCQEFTLYLVDNASKDKSIEISLAFGDPRIRIIANAANMGVAEGNNQGIRAALADDCDAVLLLNNDTVFGPKLFAHLSDGLVQYDCDMTTPKIYYHEEPKKIWAAGGYFQPFLAYRTKHFGADEIDAGQHDHAGLVDYAPTCCVLIKINVFEKVGLMDERYFVYVDDVDFMYRAMKKKIKLVYLPKAKLLHKVGRLTGGEDSPFAHRYCTRNRVYFMLRHFGPLASIPMLMVYQLYFAIGLLSRRFNFKAFQIKEKAVIEGFTLWRKHTIANYIENPQ